MAYKNAEDQKAAARAHYLRNKDKMKQRAKVATDAARVRNRQYILDYLRTHACVDCGEADPVVLEFDHVRGVKRQAVTTIAHQGVSIEVVQAEIDKCDVCCANCHRRRTARRGSHFRLVG